MRTSLVYLKLELKRAWKWLPHMYAGAIVLFLFIGTIAFLSGEMLYGEAISGRIVVGVALPEEDVLAEKALNMISSLDSVKSICDFEYLNQEEAVKKLRSGKLYALLVVPEGFVQDIMTGVNTPVQVLLPEREGVEGSLFCELTDAGAKILGASQAGIYAGNELYTKYHLESSIATLEADLNRIYLDYSLSRGDYFWHKKVSATGDINTLQFYEVSAYVLFLLLCGIPAAAYLLPWKKSFVSLLGRQGVGAGMIILSRILGLTMLFLTVSLPVGILAVVKQQIKGNGLTLAAVILVCLAMAALVVLVYQAAGNLMGGIMLLFLAGVGQHVLAGGLIPLVFFSERLQRVAAFLPATICMNGMKMAVTAVCDWTAMLQLLVMMVVCGFVSVLLEVKRL